MNKYLSYIVALIGLTFSLSSCHTSAPRLDYKALAKASVRMGIDINKEDNHKLYIASAEQIVPDWYHNSISRYTTSVYPEAPMNNSKKAIKSPVATCVREIWCFSPVVRPRKEWPMWVSILKMGNSYMPAQVKELLSAVSTSNTTRNTGFAEDE